MSLVDLVAQAKTGGVIDGVIADVPYLAFLGLRLQCDGENLQLLMPYDDRLIGSPIPPRLHGGTIGALLEIAGAVQVMSALLGNAENIQEPKSLAVPKPIGITIDYLRAGAQKDVIATATVKRLGRRIASVISEAWQDEPDKPIATAQMHFLVAAPSG